MKWVRIDGQTRAGLSLLDVSVVRKICCLGKIISSQTRQDFLVSLEHWLSRSNSGKIEILNL